MRRSLALLLALPLLSGCTGDDPTTIALLLADESGGSAVVDVEAFTARVEATCGECELEVHDAGGDAAEQTSQLRQAIEAEVDAVVVQPLEPDELEGLAPDDTALVSWITLVPGSDAFVGMESGEPEISDQGSDLEAARDLVLGERQTMTYVPVRPMAEQAADVVVADLAGKPLEGGEEHEGVPSWLYDAVEVELDTLTTVLVGDGVLTLAELCEGSTAERCRRFGLR